MREAAERLGLAESDLQRHIDQGAFPGRFLSRGAYGIETRLPLSEVEAFERLRSGPARSVVVVRGAHREVEFVSDSGTPQDADDAEAYRRLFVDLADSERLAFLEVVRRAWLERDSEIAALRREIEALRSDLRESVARVERSVATVRFEERHALPTGRATESHVDVDGLFWELGELEAMLGLGESSN